MKARSVTSKNTHEILQLRDSVKSLSLTEPYKNEYCVQPLAIAFYCEEDSNLQKVCERFEGRLFYLPGGIIEGANSCACLNVCACVRGAKEAQRER